MIWLLVTWIIVVLTFFMAVFSDYVWRLLPHKHSWKSIVATKGAEQRYYCKKCLELKKGKDES